MPMGKKETAKVDRRLTAILAADIAGYSALMGSDEARTVHDLKEHHAAVLPITGQFGGRIIDTAGDGFLAEFASVVKALECAVAIQRRMAQRNAIVEPKRCMRFRMGINIGDVIYDEARIYGNGINIAARLEAIAEPGGIFISGQAYDQVEGKLELSFRRLGPHNLKNIVKPVEVFAVDGIAGSDQGPSPDQAKLIQDLQRLVGFPNCWQTLGQAQIGGRLVEQMRILLVDDHALFREGLEALLTRIEPGAVIKHARDSAQALAAVEQEDLDVIFLDLALPDLSGMEALTLLRQRRPETPVVVLSGTEDRDTIVGAIDRDAMGYIPKSSPTSVLQWALKLVLAGQVYIPPLILNERQSGDPAAGGLRENSVEPPVGAVELGLTPRQGEVLTMLLQGKPNKMIARTLGMAEATAKAHVSAVLRALRVTNRTQAVLAIAKSQLRPGTLAHSSH